MIWHELKVHADFLVTFHRTLRVPSDGKSYPLPPGLGAFPIVPVSAHLERVPSTWRDRPGLMIPMYQREALWIGFRANPRLPCAVQVFVGGINALTAEDRAAPLSTSPQNYLVCPPQPWLDGVRTRTGTVSQFVAQPLGAAKTLEAVLTGTEEIGGIQLRIFPPHPALLKAPVERVGQSPTRQQAPRGAMGIAAGGDIAQKIYPDPQGLQVWDVSRVVELDLHLLNALAWQEVTGMASPPSPIDAAAYSKHGLPWFSLYDDDLADLPGALPLATGVAQSLERQQHEDSGQETLLLEDLKVRPLRA